MPRRGVPVQPQERARVRKLHAKGLSRNDIARQTGLSTATVSRVAKSLGLSFNREKVKAATAAKVADARAVRADTSLKFLAKTNELLDQMDLPHLAFAFGGRDNNYNEHWLDRPPTGDLRNLMTAASIAFNSHLKADLHDADTGAAGARSVLGALAAGLHVAARQIDGAEPDDE